MAKKTSSYKTVETIKHDADKRKNIPTAEYQSIQKKEQAPKTIRYPRNTDLDSQRSGVEKMSRTGVIWWFMLRHLVSVAGRCVLTSASRRDRNSRNYEEFCQKYSELLRRVQ